MNASPGRHDMITDAQDALVAILRHDDVPTDLVGAPPAAWYEHSRSVLLTALAIPDTHARDVAVAALAVFGEFIGMCEDPETPPSEIAGIVGTLARFAVRREGIAQQRAVQRVKRYAD
ncbi:hypothetical protein ABT158_48555 [Nonomuraea sp. NPDC001636]|uniref:hypothetical protein n=1 Tax=Nonomuraea sp. NPDC001636 TaxID=3154391 RepID=UPI0033277767